MCAGAEWKTWCQTWRSTYILGNMRLQVSPQQVAAVIKKWRREQQLDVDDACAVDALVPHYSDQQAVLHYQPYRSATDTAAEQPFVLILSTPFQQRMLDQFGRRLVFLDATGGTNKYGYAFYTLLVQDDFGRGVPVAFMLTNSEAMEEIQLLLGNAASGVRLHGLAVRWHAPQPLLTRMNAWPCRPGKQEMAILLLHM